MVWQQFLCYWHKRRGHAFKINDLILKTILQLLVAILYYIAFFSSTTSYLLKALMLYGSSFRKPHYNSLVQECTIDIITEDQFVLVLM